VAFSVLTVNGTAYNQSARKTNSLLVDGWGWDVDGDYTLDFHEYSAGPQPKFQAPYAVSLADPSGTLRFTGDIVGVYPTWTDVGRSWGYRCLGLKYRANQVPVTAIDGSGTIVYNLPFSDENYIAANSGLSVGTILATVLTDHATALTAAGITTDATTASQLAAITLVPSDPVYIEGARLWQALETVLQRWQKNLRLIILPTGKVRVVDVTLGAAHTLTLGTDPVDPPLFSRAWENCATRYVARGRGKIYPGYVDLVKNTLTPSWSLAQQNAWKFSEFSNPSGATDTGTVASVTSATTVNVQSADGSRTWATNFWNGIGAWVQLFKSSGGGALTYQESRPVTACTSLSAGGVATLTLGYALDNSASGAFDSYKLTGTAPTLADGGLNGVWRLFDVTDPGLQIAHHLVKKFPVAFPFQFLNNIAAVNTLYPIAQVITPSDAFNATFKVIPQTGQILFDRPVCEQLNSLSVLAAGGSSVVGPSNIYAMLAYSRGALTATYPPDSGGLPVYSGTAFTDSGLERTRYGDLDNFAYEGNSSIVVDYAANQQQALRDTVVSGKVVYKGALTAVYDPAGGHLLNFAGNGYTTGDEALNIPVRSLQVQYVCEGGAGVNYITTMNCDTRRDPRTGDSFYMHLSQRGSGQSAFGDYFNPFGVAQPGFADMRAMAAANDSTSHLMDYQVDQGESLGLGFAGPGKNASQKKRRERLHEQQRQQGTYDRETTKSESQLRGEAEDQAYEAEAVIDQGQQKAAAQVEESARVKAQGLRKARQQQLTSARVKAQGQRKGDAAFAARMHRENGIPQPDAAFHNLREDDDTTGNLAGGGE
jgi:hypothetical protein